MSGVQGGARGGEEGDRGGAAGRSGGKRQGDQGLRRSGWDDPPAIPSEHNYAALWGCTMYTFVVDVPKKHTKALQSVLDKHGAGYWMVGRKALGFPDTIIVIAAALTVARHIYFFAQKLRERHKQADPDIDIVIRLYSISEFGPTPHQIATKKELREAITGRSSAEPVDEG